MNNYWTRLEDNYINTIITGTTRLQHQAFESLIPALENMIEAIYYRYFKNYNYFGEDRRNLNSQLTAFCWTIIPKFNINRGKSFSFIQTCIKNWLTDFAKKAHENKISFYEIHFENENEVNIINSLNYCDWQVEEVFEEDLKLLAIKKIDKHLANPIHSGDTTVLNFLKNYLTITDEKYVNKHSLSFACYRAKIKRSKFRQIVRRYNMILFIANLSTLEKIYGKDILELDVDLANHLAKDYHSNIEINKKKVKKVRTLIFK